MERTPFIVDVFHRKKVQKQDKDSQCCNLELDSYPQIRVPFSVDEINIKKFGFNKQNAILLPQTEPQYYPTFFRKNRKISISKKDLNTLNPRNWLSDEVMNSYLNFLHNSNPETTIGYTNTFFYEALKRNGYKDANQWSGISGYRVDNFFHFLIPITTGAHWILIDLDFERGVLNVYDSYMKKYNSIVKDIVGFLEFQGVPPLKINFPSVPLQTTSYDCGVFVLKFATMIYENQTITEDSFTQNDLIQFRRNVKDILSKYLEE